MVLESYCHFLDFGSPLYPDYAVLVAFSLYSIVATNAKPPKQPKRHNSVAMLTQASHYEKLS
jgi:hypothetical protein